MKKNERRAMKDFCCSQVLVNSPAKRCSKLGTSQVKKKDRSSNGSYRSRSAGNESFQVRARRKESKASSERFLPSQVLVNSPAKRCSTLVSPKSKRMTEAQMNHIGLDRLETSLSRSERVGKKSMTSNERFRRWPDQQ